MYVTIEQKEVFEKTIFKSFSIDDIRCCLDEKQASTNAGWRNKRDKNRVYIKV